MTLSEDIGRYIASSCSAPNDARARAVEGCVDAIGVLLAGRRAPVVAAVRALAAPATKDGDRATLLFGRSTARAADAALVNGTAAHVLAMDDVAGPLHPSASLMPALFAAAEAADVSGRALTDAYVVGFEVLAELAGREHGSLHDTGWHPTGVLGPVGAAAATARLWRLPAERAAHAIGIAASLTGGLQGNFGSETKALHLGRVASAGIVAARLAAAGVTAQAAALDGSKGLLRTVSPDGDVDVTAAFSADPSRPRIATDGLSFKKYPVCYTTHRVVDAAIALARLHAIAPERVARVTVSIGRRQAAMASFGMPTTPLEAKYSVPFAVASALVAQAAGLAELDPAFIASAAIRRIIERTHVVPLDSTQRGEPVFASADRVVVTLDDARVFDSGDVAYARGHAVHPWSPADHRSKFVDCAVSTDVESPEALYDALMRLDECRSVRALVEQIARPRS